MGIITKLNLLKLRLQSQLKLIHIKKNKNINIARDTTIYENVQIETNYGGSITIGSNNEILYGACLMTYGGKIDIGNNCSINPYTIIYGHGKGVKIGNNVLIAGHTMIIPSNHIYTSLHNPINQQGSTSKGIIIEDDVWLGSGVKVLDGVT
ncbi:MAG: acyltransferase, partial [Flavobacterium sp.]